MRYNGKAEESPYFWWYEYLKCHDGYRACCERGGKGSYAKLYRDFGDVHHVPFATWWRSVRNLFEGPEPFVVDVLKTPQQFRMYSEDDSVLIAAINLNAPKEAIERELRIVATARRPRGRGRPQWDDSLSEYPLEPWPDVQFLKKALTVWKIKNSSSPDRLLWEIGKEAKVGLSYATARSSDPGGWNRRILRNMTRRYLVRADAIINNAARGRFPLSQ
jgi:hypothetical protein